VLTETYNFAAIFVRYTLTLYRCIALWLLHTASQAFFFLHVPLTVYSTTVYTCYSFEGIPDGLYYHYDAMA